MMRKSVARPEPAHAERPTGAAQLKIALEPARVKVIAKRWGSLEGTVPPADARYLIAAACILASTGMSISGAVLTLRIVPKFPGLALAELVLGLVSVLLIAACARLRNTRNTETDQLSSQEVKRLPADIP
jgi:hypothetical protein